MDLFSDNRVRQEFIIGITEILAQIYNVMDSTLKLSIFHELEKLSDTELMEKKNLIEKYLSHSTLLNQNYISKATRIEHEYLEEEEKKDLILQNMF